MIRLERMGLTVTDFEDETFISIMSVQLILHLMLPRERPLTRLPSSKYRVGLYDLLSPIAHEGKHLRSGTAVVRICSMVLHINLAAGGRDLSYFESTILYTLCLWNRDLAPLSLLSVQNLSVFSIHSP